MARISKLFTGAALLALAGATLLHLGVLAGRGAVWASWIHLTLFGWITGFIFAVSYHTMPVFTGRRFGAQQPLYAHWAAFSLGVALATIGLATGAAPLYRLGLGLEWLSSLLFVANIVALLRGPAPGPRMPAPPYQPPLDRLGTRATIGAGASLPLALSLLLLAEFGWLDWRWHLAAEHTATLGWVMLMIVGVAAHVLPRWAATPARDPRWLRGALACHGAALLLMVPALGMGWQPVFALGAALMTIALALAAWTFWPTLRSPRPGRLDVMPARRAANALSPLSLRCIGAAGLALAGGIGLGVTFACVPRLGALLRPAHAELNLWGFAGLLIYGMAYHMIPRFAANPLRSPRAADWQSWLAIGGSAATVAGWLALAGALPGARWLLLGGGALQTAAAAIFGALMLAALRRRPPLPAVSGQAA